MAKQTLNVMMFGHTMCENQWGLLLAEGYVAKFDATLSFFELESFVQPFRQ